MLKELMVNPVSVSSMLLSAEAIVVVRESAARAVSEVLDQFHTSGGVRMMFSVVEIPDQEDSGTADSLRAIRTRVKVGVEGAVLCEQSRSHYALLSKGIMHSCPSFRIHSTHVGIPIGWTYNQTCCRQSFGRAPHCD